MVTLWQSGLKYRTRSTGPDYTYIKPQFGSRLSCFICAKAMKPNHSIVSSLHSICNIYIRAKFFSLIFSVFHILLYSLFFIYLVIEFIGKCIVLLITLFFLLLQKIKANYILLHTCMVPVDGLGLNYHFVNFIFKSKISLTLLLLKADESPSISETTTTTKTVIGKADEGFFAHN